MMTLLTIEEVSSITRCSVSTVRRRIADARKGLSTFPLSIHGDRKRGLWRLDDIELWNESPSPDMPNVPYDTPTTRQRRLKAIHNELLEKYNIKVGDGNQGANGE